MVLRRGGVLFSFIPLLALFFGEGDISRQKNRDLLALISLTVLLSGIGGGITLCRYADTRCPLCRKRLPVETPIQPIHVIPDTHLSLLYLQVNLNESQFKFNLA